LSPAQQSRQRDEGLGSEPSTQTNDCLGKSDGKQAPLSQFAQLVKANRWVQIGHTLLEADDPTNVLAGFEILVALLHFIE